MKVVRAEPRPKVRTEHTMHVLERHQREHPNLPGRYIDCRCDLCDYARRLPTS